MNLQFSAVYILKCTVRCNNCDYNRTTVCQELYMELRAVVGQSFFCITVCVYIREIIMCELQECQVMNIPDMVADLMDEEHLCDAQCTRFTNV